MNGSRHSTNNKTKTPYKGPAYDLHKAAHNWLDKHNFFSQSFLGWKSENLFFEEKKVAKIERVTRCKCTHYVDDLIEILNLLPSTIKKIHYNPTKTKFEGQKIYTMSDWSQLISTIND